MKKYLPFILIIAIGSGIFGYMQYNKSHKETDGATADVVISPKELLDAYDGDESAANQLYLDKIIEVEGTVRSINEVEVGSSISLDTGDEMSSIICEFEMLDAISSVKVGDKVTVKGFCTGKLMDIVLVRCSL